MPVEEFGGGPTRSTKPKGGGGGGGGGKKFLTAPSRPSSPIRPGQVPAGQSGGKGSGDKDSGKVTDPYAAAQAAATASANRSYSNAASRYDRQAKNLEAQAAALKSALNKDLKKGLLQQISDIDQSRRQQGEILREGFRERMKHLRGAAKDNDKAAAQQSGINQLNQIRERSSALSEAMSQGAGESDTLKAMLMSLRNWNANQTEVERGYFDTLRSIQSSQTDLEVDTKTALMNNQLQANADKEQLWTNYYNQRSELYTQLGNTRGQQADYYAMASEARANIEGAKADTKAGAKAGAKASAKAGAKASGNLGTKKGAEQARPGKTGGAKAETGKGGPLMRTAVEPDVFRTAVEPDLDDFRVNASLTPRVGAQATTDRQRPPRTPGGRAEQGKGGRGKNKDEDRRGAIGGGKKGPGPLQGPGNRKVTGIGRNAKSALAQSRKAFMQASKAAGRSWNNPGVTDAVMEWEGADPIKGQENNLNRLDTVTEAQLERKKPEGASLRKWV